MMSAKGWVYIMTNPAFKPGFLKIGMTQKMPEMRARELHTTGVPLPFAVEYCCLVEDARQVETELHRHFRDHRSASDREFFQVPLSEIVGFIRETCSILHEEVGANPDSEGLTDQLIEEISTVWVPKEFRGAYVEAKQKYQALRKQISSLSGVCPEVLAPNPYPAPPNLFRCGTPALQEIEEQSYEDNAYQSGAMREAEYEDILENRRKQDALRQVADRGVRERYRPWFEYEEKLKSREEEIKLWHSNQSCQRRLQEDLRELLEEVQRFERREWIRGYREEYESEMGREI